MPIISLIAAIDNNNAIGKRAKLLCHLPADLAYFKKLTTGHTVIMGRKTFESLPNGALPNRRNIVLSRNKGLNFENAENAASLDKALKLCGNEDEVFIIGGGEVYEEAVGIAHKLYITVIDYSFDEADTFFPFIDRNRWEKIKSESHQSDENNKYGYTFEVYNSIS